MVHEDRTPDLTIDYIWSSICPNVSVCRDVVDEAIARFNGFSVVLREWQIEGELPAYCEGYGSPTILVDGIDVGGARPDAFNECCRVYATMYEIRGVPLVEEVVIAMESALKAKIESNDSGQRRV